MTDKYQEARGKNPTGIVRFKAMEWSTAPPLEIGQGGFVTLQKGQARSIYDDGSKSAWYTVETARPAFRDAVVLALFAREDGTTLVGLRRNVRPAVTLRNDDPHLNQLDGAELSGAMWELPAGGIEEVDLAPQGGGVLGRAVAETWEEAGIRIQPQDLRPMGPSPFSVPSFCTERLHYFCALVEPAKAQTPPGDGHPMEDGAEMRFIDLGLALDWCRSGKVCDLKTEVGLYRLVDYLKHQ